MAKKGTRYPAEFRAEAIRLYQNSGRSRREIADELGVAQETLRRWVIQADVDDGRRDGLTTEEHEELRKLRREVRNLQMERDLLKKFAAFFAREQDPIRS